jgi:hypothetical protein
MPQYLTGAQWTDAAVRVGSRILRPGGSFIVRPDIGRLALSVTSRDPLALGALRYRFGVGEIHAHSMVADLHVWRVAEPSVISHVLSHLIDFLNTKLEAARTALLRLDEFAAPRAKRADRDRHILRLHELDLYTHAEIAEMTGTTPHTVANVIKRWRRENGITIHLRRRVRTWSPQ